MPAEPLLDEHILVRMVVVNDQVQLAPRIAAIQQLQEVQEVADAMADQRFLI